MSTKARPRRALAALACLASGLGLAVSAPGISATASSPAADVSVTVLLAAPHPAALSELGRRHHLSRTTRSTRLRALLPTARTRHRVAARLREHGFQITSQGTWQVTASAPEAVVDRTFGDPTTSGALTGSDFLGDGVATVARASSEPLLRPTSSTSGADYRNAYAVAGSPASNGDNAAGRTIATIQFAQWDSSNLTAYAATLGRPDPVATGQYTGVRVGTGAAVDSNGALEVALDQESLLATAPTARQRAYFAPNSADGFTQAFTAIANDAATYNITAVSVSWGNCEAAWPTTLMRNLEPVLRSVNAAGVTIFNSSGDNGIYGCSNGAVSTSFPASSPSVVAVGGTTLSASDRSANNGSNWLETAWDCTGSTDCLGGGSGGGSSAVFARPTWQTNTLAGTMATGTRRLVPDIAAVGDPSTGFRVFSGGSYYLVGGTSLAAPVAAALLTDALTDAGIGGHVGDLHEALYSAYQTRRATVFRDVTIGSNGAAADAGADPSVCAGDGYDTVTGLGGVLWSGLVPLLSGTTTAAPVAVAANTCSTPQATTPSTPGGTGSTTTTTTVTAPPGPSAEGRLTAGRERQGRVGVLARWSTVRRSTVALLATRVRLVDVTTGRVLWSGTGFQGSRAVRVRSGHVVRLTVVAADVNGSTSRATATRRTRS